MSSDISSSPTCRDLSAAISRSAPVDARIELEFERTTTPWEFASAEQYVSFTETNYGPLLKARDRLTAEGTWEQCRSEIVALAEDLNVAADGSLHFDAEYL